MGCKILFWECISKCHIRRCMRVLKDFSVRFYRETNGEKSLGKLFLWFCVFLPPMLSSSLSSSNLLVIGKDCRKGKQKQITITSWTVLLASPSNFFYTHYMPTLLHTGFKFSLSNLTINSLVTELHLFSKIKVNERPSKILPSFHVYKEVIIQP